LSGASATAVAPRPISEHEFGGNYQNNFEDEKKMVCLHLDLQCRQNSSFLSNITLYYLILTKIALILAKSD